MIATCKKRRGRDSNPGYRLTPYDSLANCCLKPLGHLSSATQSYAEGGKDSNIPSFFIA